MLSKTFVIISILSTVLALPAVPDEINANDNVAPAIIDGNIVTQVNYYQVAIVSDSDDPAKTKVCTGALFSVGWVITSAYCAKRKDVLRVIMGTTDGSWDLSGATGYLIAKKHIHPAYNPTSLLNDIALLELKLAVQPEGITLVSLPTSIYQNYVGQTGLVSGFGAIGNFGTINPYPGAIYCKEVDIIENSICSKHVSYPLNNYKLCTEGRATCEGDQGAPLVVQGKLIGIASGSLEATQCESSLAVTYTRVSYYISWISSVTRGQCKC